MTAGGELESRSGNPTILAGLRLEMIAPRAGVASGMHVALSPYGSLVLQSGPITFHANVARISQFPDLQFVSKIAFDDTLAGGRARRGAAQLGYENAITGEVGFRMRLGASTFGAALFARRFDHLVQSAPTPNPDTSVLSNSGGGSVTGAELRWGEAIRGAWVT